MFPKRCGHMAGKEVVATGEWLAKLRSALATRTHLFVCARTDARAPLGLDAAIERGRVAADLGVDAVFVEAPQSLDELAAVGEALGDRGVTLVANMVESGHTPLLTPDELGELGFGLVVSPGHRAVRRHGHARRRLRPPAPQPAPPAIGSTTWSPSTSSPTSSTSPAIGPATCPSTSPDGA